MKIISEDFTSRFIKLRRPIRLSIHDTVLKFFKERTLYFQTL